MRLSHSIQEQRISFHLFKLPGFFFLSYSLQSHPSLTLRSLVWVALSLIWLRGKSGHTAQVLSIRVNVGFRNGYMTWPGPMSISWRTVSASVRKERQSAGVAEVIERKASVVWKESKNKANTKKKTSQGMEWARLLTTILVHQDPALPDRVPWSQYI